MTAFSAFLVSIVRGNFHVRNVRTLELSAYAPSLVGKGDRRRSDSISVKRETTRWWMRLSAVGNYLFSIGRGNFHVRNVRTLELTAVVGIRPLYGVLYDLLYVGIVEGRIGLVTGLEVEDLSVAAAVAAA